jgi:hypothetical protein
MTQTHSSQISPAGAKEAQEIAFGNAQSQFFARNSAVDELDSKTGGEIAFNTHIKRIEEAAVDSIYTDLRLRGTDEWTEVVVKERASNFVTTLLTSFTYDRA